VTPIFTRFAAYFIGAFLLASCSKKNSSPEPAIQKPTITSIAPTTVKGGDIITVFGKNLLKDIAHTSLLINGKVAQMTVTTNDSIKGVVPVMAGTGTVTLTVGTESYDGPSCTYRYKVTVTTIAGNGLVGSTDGPGLQASFNCPWGIAANPNGDLFIADTYNRLIRKLTAPNYVVSTYSIPTLVNGANFYSPYNIAVDTVTQNLYVTDFNQHLMKMTPSGNMDVIYSDVMPLTGIAVDPNSSHLYVSNNTNGTIVRLDMDGKNMVPFAANLVTPRNIIFNNKGQMFVAAFPGPVYQIGSNGSANPIGSGTKFDGWEIATDTLGNFYLADHVNNNIRMIEKSGSSIIIAGSGQAADIDGVGLEASFNGPQGITIDTKGTLYVTTYNYNSTAGNRVRKIVLE
jgi:hypothetical protein